MKDPQIARLERYEEKEDWPKAIELNKKMLAKNPDSHWLLTNLSSNYHEARQYKTALKFSEKAMKVAPRCPLVLWDYAGVLDSLDRTKEARAIWQGLLRRGVDGIAHGECGEGKRWAESLLNDCRYCLGLSYAEEGRKAQATKWFKAHLENRRPGQPSLYTARDVRQTMRALG